MELHIENISDIDVDSRKLEVVERKGIGHPDTLADGIADAVSSEYAKYCLEHFGHVLHHNSDKTALLGGSSIVRFGGGEITSPINVTVNGRFTKKLGDKEIPYIDIINQATKNHIGSILKNIDVENHIRVQTRLSTASSPGFVQTKTVEEASRKFWFEPRDLNDLSEIKRLHSNDTSYGVGYAPYSALETYVLNVERTLNSSNFKEIYPHIGSDIKIMGVRKDREIMLTACVPLIDKFVNSVDEYKHYLGLVQQTITELCPNGYSVKVHLNTRDNFERPELYLTVTGSAIESGDEGLVGRGNRTNGLITPMRLMSLEGACGKNPVYHVGKLYNVIAGIVAQKLFDITNQPTGVVLVSQSGRDLTDPWFVNILHASNPKIPHKQEKTIIEEVFSDLPKIRQDIISRKILLY